MERWLSSRQAMMCNPDGCREALIDSTAELLQIATGTEVGPPAGDGSLSLRLRAEKGGSEAHKYVRAHVGQARVRRHWLSIPLRWEADIAPRLFPSFDGAIEFEEQSATRGELVIVGHYRPPLGPVGDVLDMTLLSQVADSTVRSLADQLARALVRRVHGDTAPEARRGIAMTVEDVMTRDPFTVDESTSLRDAAALLLRTGVSGVPVVDRHDQVVGVISQRDLLDKAASAPTGLGRAYAEAERHRRALTAGDACTKPAKTTSADSLLRDAAREMANRDVDRLVVLDGARHVGIVTRSDVLRALVRDDEVIAEAVAQVLASVDGDEVVMTVENGHVSLAGQIERRSDAAAIPAQVRRIDGVMDVVDELSWKVDDVIPVMPPLL